MTAEIIRRPRISPATIKAIRERIRDGVKVKDAAAEFNLNPTSVARFTSDLPRRRAQRTWTPGCMEPDEVALWRDGLMPACVECPLAYYERQLAAGRCNGFPALLMRGAIDPNENADVTEPRRRRMLPD